MTKPQTREEKEGKTLYVVFHGEIAFFDSRDTEQNIQAFAPEMDIHVYMAGPWLGEHLIPKGLTLGLSGVHHGAADFVKDGLKTVTFTGASLTKNARHMHLDLPRPDGIYYGGLMYVEPKKTSVSGDQTVDFPMPKEAGGKAVTAVSIVFKYRVKAGATPEFYVKDGELMPGFEPSWIADGTDDYLVLHVFAESDTIPGAMHIQMASEASAALLGVKATVSVDATSDYVKMDKSPLPGLTRDEIRLTLADRECATTDLGEQFQTDPSGSLHWHDPIDERGTKPRHGRTPKRAFGGASSCGPSAGSGN